MSKKVVYERKAYPRRVTDRDGNTAILKADELPKGIWLTLGKTHPPKKGNKSGK